MNALLRAALVGAVIGLVESVIADYVMVDDGFLALFAMLIVPFPLGLSLCLWDRAPTRSPPPS